MIGPRIRISLGAIPRRIRPLPMLESYTRNERRFQSEWLSAPFLPPRELTVQASGLCFTADGRLTLVSDGSGWVCPGGYPEAGETLEGALRREVAEEACARVLEFEYIGAIRTHESPPLKPGARALCYQARYWARIEHDIFTPRHEMVERRSFAPAEFVGQLRWNAKATAALMLAAALAVESRQRRAP